MIEAAGFTIVAGPDPADLTNLLIRRSQDQDAGTADLAPISSKSRAPRR